MENLNYVIHLFHSGGFVMWPLLFLSLMIIAIAAERAYFFHKYGGQSKVVSHAVEELAKLKQWDEIEKTVNESNSLASRVARAGLDNAYDETTMKAAIADQMGMEVVGFKRYMDYLSATVTISPLLGLLGTVTGMIGSFSILDSGAGASAITGGVGEALIATASGLCVAIIAFGIYTYFSHKLDTIINNIESMCVSLINAKREGWR